MAAGNVVEKAKDFEARVERRAGLDSQRLEAAGIDPAVYLRVVLNAGVLNPALFDCDERSIDEAIMRSINAGLLPDGREAAIIPFKGSAQFVPMIDGELKLAHRATPGLSVWTRLVYDSDEFDYEEGMFPRLKHKVDPLGGRDDDQLVAAYAVAHMPRGSQPSFVVMYRSEIERYRGFSPSRESKRSAWNTHYPEMSRKTVLRRLLHALPVPAGLDRSSEDTDGLALGVELEGSIDLPNQEAPQQSAQESASPAVGSDQSPDPDDAPF